MNKALGAVVVLTGLVVVAGCAREDRWTLDGSRPRSLARTSPNITAAEERVSSGDVDLVQDDGFCSVRNKSSDVVEATVQVKPGLKNTPAEPVRERTVLVPANSQVQVGRTSDGGGNEWSYRLLKVSHR